MIFCFTATGNCRYVAEQIDSDARSTPQETQREGELAYKDEGLASCTPFTAI